MTPQQERAALLTAWAQYPGLISLSPLIFAGPWEWAGANLNAMKATTPVQRRASGRRIKYQQRRESATRRDGQEAMA